MSVSTHCPVLHENAFSPYYPFQNEIYSAVKIGQPDTNIIMRYRQFEKEDGGKLILIHEKPITVTDEVL